MINNNSTSLNGRGPIQERSVSEKLASKPKTDDVPEVKAATAADIKAAESPKPMDNADAVSNAKASSEYASVMAASLSQAQPLDDEQKAKVTEAIAKVEDYMQDNQRTLNFEMAEEENRVIITVIDRETNEVIRQIPPEDMVKMSDSISSTGTLSSSGVLIHSKA